MTTIRLSRLHHPVTTLGPGVRAGVWVQGCPIGCRGCMSTDTWEAGPEHEIDTGEVLRWLDTLDRVDGVTISGGEPFEQPEAVRALVTEIARSRPDADILVYSGYPFSVSNAGRLRRLCSNAATRSSRVRTWPDAIRGADGEDRPTSGW